MTNTPTKATPRSVRDELRNAYKQASDFEGSLYSALFAALTMLEKMEARLAALEAARPVDTPKVLYEGEAWIVDAHPTNPTFHFNSAMLRTSSNRVHVVVTAAEEDDES